MTNIRKKCLDILLRKKFNQWRLATNRKKLDQLKTETENNNSINKNDINNSKEDVLFKMLNKWNYEFTPESREATLYAILERNLCTFLFTNKKNKDKFNSVLNYFSYYQFVHGMIEKITRMVLKCIS